MGVQYGKIGFRKIKHQADSMISKKESKGFADIIIGNDGDFHILSQDKAINLSALKNKQSQHRIPNSLNDN